MNYILLLGAGFSKNWNGWLADEMFDRLLGCPEIEANAALREIVWSNERAGFESALEFVQSEFEKDPASEPKRLRLDAMQGAVTRLFQEMNRAFLGDVNFESHSNREGTVRGLLSRFHAIFTLNQDVLLEHHYRDNFDIALEAPQRWNSMQIPGMRRLPVAEPLFDKSWARAQWQPLPDAEYRIEPRSQPYFKLHGSANWISSKGNPLLVIGGSKDQEIQRHKILSRYALEFRERLYQPDTRLMVIGYGFRDHHINRIIDQAVFKHDLKMFVIAPRARELARVFSSPAHDGIPLVVYGYDLEAIFRKSLIGVSQRPLRETFGRDALERSKVMQFFAE